MKIDLLDIKKLSEIQNPTKLKKCLTLAFEDSKEAIQILRKAGKYQFKGSEPFFCFLKCNKGFGMDILVKPETMEVEFKSIGCDFCSDKCVDRYSFCNNFYIFTKYVSYKNQEETEKIFQKIIGGKDEKERTIRKNSREVSHKRPNIRNFGDNRRL